MSLTVQRQLVGSIECEHWYNNCNDAKMSAIWGYVSKEQVHQIDQFGRFQELKQI